MSIQTNSERILIVGPAWVGDIVMAQTLFKILKQQNAQIVIDVLTPAWSMPLLERIPEINRMIEIPFRKGDLKIKERYQFGKSLRGKNYQRAIVLPTSFKSALISFFAKIPLRTGFIGECRYFILNDLRKHFKKYCLRIDQYIALAGVNCNDKRCFEHIDYFKKPKSMIFNPVQTAHYFSYALPSLVVKQVSLETTLQKHTLCRKNKRILALCPSSAVAYVKRWPAEYFGIVANQLLDLDWQIWLFGTEQDKRLAQSIQMQTKGRCVDLVGETTLTEAVDLLSFVDAVVANDSGLAHVAAALNKPVVAIYGPTSPYHVPPLTKKAKILYNENVDCRPCCAKQSCPYGHRCMRTILPEFVLEAILDCT